MGSSRHPSRERAPSPHSALPPPAVDDVLSASYQSTDTVRRHPDTSGYGLWTLSFPLGKFTPEVPCTLTAWCPYMLQGRSQPLLLL